MQFSITTTLLSLALATVGLAAPAANPSAAEVVQRDTDTKPFDWNEGWDGKVTPIEEIGEDVTVSLPLILQVFVCSTC